MHFLQNPFLFYPCYSHAAFLSGKNTDIFRILFSVTVYAVTHFLTISSSFKKLLDIPGHKAYTHTLKMFRETTMELDRLYSAFARSCGLSDPEFWSLLLIYEGYETQSQISEQLSLSRQTLNSAFKQLIKKGFVRLIPYEHNQRTKQAVLTESGEKYVEEHILTLHQMEEQAWRQMTSEERRMLVESSRKFTNLLKNIRDNEKNKDN